MQAGFGPYLLISVAVIAIHGIVSMFTGIGITDENPFNSYSLQADSWLNGRFDLGRDHKHLELAIYEGKYYVSFPPFPSFILIPLVSIFGVHTPDNFLTLVAGVLAAIYAFKISLNFGRDAGESVMWSLFVTIGGNLLFIIASGGVWFIAQTFYFALMMASIYYSITGIRWHGYLSLALWSFAVGCRPFVIIFLPVLVYLLYDSQKEAGLTLFSYLKKNWKFFLIPIIVGSVYASLNFLRFDDPFSFGREYLPEFSDHPQFSRHYLLPNLLNLVRLPEIADSGRIIVPKFNGMAFWLVSPIFISGFVYLVRYLVREGVRKAIFPLVIIFLVGLNLLFLLLHRTMGGWHFGNRYTVDLLPLIFLVIMITIKGRRSYAPMDYPLFLLGLCLNLIGTIAIYNSWI